MNEPTKRKRRHFSDDQRAALVRPHRGDTLPVSDLAGFVQRGLEKFPRVTPRIISDNGPQFTARDSHSFVHVRGLTHTRTSPYHP